jgi:phage terminase large subunit-like protein
MVQGEIEQGAFEHDGDSRLSRHVGNARRRPNRWGISIGKESPKSPRKIDGDVAMIIARHARRLVLGSKEWKERKDRKKNKGGRVWSFS